MSNKILVFIPSYNCEKQITRVLSQFDENVSKFITEVIVINNISTDSTEATIINYLKEQNNFLPVKLLRNNENYGLGGSHKVAFDYAKINNYNYVIVLHGDDQADIHDLIPLIETKEYLKYDSLLGSRFMKNSKLRGYSFIRTIGNYGYNFLFSVICGFLVKDLGSGLNMYRIDSLRNNYYFNYPDNLVFNYCMVMAIHFYKQNINFFPIKWKEEDQVSNVKLFSQGHKVLKLLFSYAFSKKKFMDTDHRDKKIDKYEAEVIFDNRKNS